LPAGARNRMGARVERIVILGASGGIGQALADAAQARGADVVRLGRPAIDLDRPESFEEAAAAAGEALTHVIIATGLLHGELNGEPKGPERDWRQLDHDWMLANFRVNAVLPALAARALLPRLRKDGRAVFAVLTARVGSIGDNRLGGWHSYRASKAAANQLVRTLAVELARKNAHAIIAALHPGTVDTGLSKPFQRNVRPEALFTPDTSAGHLWRVIDGLKREDSGGFFAWDGAPIPW
jgi:NAD(P)-dependent dehydrogenase (short-subunit alcohol dehydrogenase family)